MEGDSPGKKPHIWTQNPETVNTREGATSDTVPWKVRGKRETRRVPVRRYY